MQFVIVTSFRKRDREQNAERAVMLMAGTDARRRYLAGKTKCAAQWKIEHAMNRLRWSGVWIIISVVLLVSTRTFDGVPLLCMCIFLVRTIVVVVAIFVFISHYCRHHCTANQMKNHGQNKFWICRSQHRCRRTWTASAITIFPQNRHDINEVTVTNKGKNEKLLQHVAKDLNRRT